MPVARKTGSRRAKPKSAKMKAGNAQLRKEADALWSRAVALSWGLRCAICGRETNRDAHHLVTRSTFATRYNLTNGILLCPGCHTLSSTLSAHKTPLAFADWLEEARPELRKWARTHRNDLTKATRHWYLAQIALLTDIKARLETT